MSTFISYINIFVHDEGKSMHNEFSSDEKVTKKEASLLTPLSYLALHKEGTIEEIAKAVGKNYSTILRATNQLVKNGFVYIRFERTAPKGKELRYYALTSSGLITYLSKNLTLNDVREVAKSHRDRMLVFKKWDRFSAAKCEEDIFLRLKEALRLEQQRYSFQYNLDFYALFGRMQKKEKELSSLEFFDVSVLGLTFMDQPIDYVKENHAKEWDALQKIWRVVAEDYELRKKRDEILSYLEREHNEGLKAIAEWKRYLKQDQGKQ